jgi:hypothetical protein
MGAPKFKVDDVVYLRSSASISGALESYTVTGVSQNQGEWMYRIGVPSRPGVVSMVGDRNSNLRSYNIDFPESDLCTLREAVDTARSYHVQKIAKLDGIAATYFS